MTIPELLLALASPPDGGPGGYLLTTTDGGLEYHVHGDGPAVELPDEIRDAIVERKAAIVVWLRTPADQLPPRDLVALGYAPGAARQGWAS